MWPAQGARRMWGPWGFVDCARAPAQQGQPGSTDRVLTALLLNGRGFCLATAGRQAGRAGMHGQLVISAKVPTYVGLYIADLLLVSR